MIDNNDFTWREVGERVRNRRVALHVSQDALAVAAGLTQNGVFKVEAGETNPQLSTLQGIARALDCSVRDLIVGIPEGDPALTAPVRRVQRILQSGDDVAIRVMETGFENAEAFLNRGCARGRRGLPPTKTMNGDGRQRLGPAEKIVWKSISLLRTSEDDDQLAVVAGPKGGKAFRDTVGDRETTDGKKR